MQMSDVASFGRLSRERLRSGVGGSGARVTYDEGVRVYTYVLRVDAGYAPNPFHGVCTLRAASR